MAGSANTPPNASLAQALQQAGIAAFQVSGTGTSLDGKWVLGAMSVDPATGLPAAANQVTAIAAKGNKALGTPTINNSATLLLAANANRKTAIITNPKTAAQTLYIGVSGVTTSSYTVSLEPGDTYIDNDSSDAWYGVVASSTLVPNVTEVA